MSDVSDNPRIALACEGLGLRLSGVEILSDISLSFETGKIHAIVGPNGGGKTSLIRCLLGQMTHSGTIYSSLGNEAVIGYVPQFLDFDKTLPVTVYDFLNMVSERRRPGFLKPKPNTRAAIEETLQRVGLDGKRFDKLGSLSGGERQRVLFAQALMPAPQLLVLDEPTTSLDQAGETVLLRLLKELKEQGTTVLWIAHDLEQVQQSADTVTGIQGTVRFHGSPAEVLPTTNLFELFRQGGAL